MDGDFGLAQWAMTAFSERIWDMKYRFKEPNGTPIDITIEDTWRRVSRALAGAEKDPASWEEVFYRTLQGFKFIPAGRIITGAGTARKVTLFNCFVMGDIPDDMAGIFESLKEAALTMQQGGGIGYDFSSLRPKGAPVKGVGADASGPLSFMNVWDAMCRTIMSAGARRGAMMGVIRCDHPDVEAFIEAKSEVGRLRMFNLSVLVTDAFMAAVKADDSWNLTFDGTLFKTLRARELWDKIMRATYAYAEPGVIFIDRINRLNNLHYCETIHGTNPCVTAETQVLTRDGWRRIDQLSQSVEILGADGDWHSIAPSFQTGAKPVFRLRTEHGYQVRLTSDHQVLTGRGDVPAGELVLGKDEVVLRGEFNGLPKRSRDVVVALEPDGEEVVWDLTEPVTSHFVANGIVVHNCGEQPLPPYGVCLLGSVNLATLVREAFSEDAHLDEAALAEAVQHAVRMLDNVIDVSNYPLDQHRQEALNKRRIGLGVTGLADALIMCRARYGSDEAVALVHKWCGLLRREAYLASVDLAKEKGPFPLFDADAYLAGEGIQALDVDVQQAIREHGIRNALVTSIAPTGTISLLANNISSGLEPVFSFAYTRKVLRPDGGHDEEEIVDYAVALFREKFGPDAQLPEYMVNAQTLAPEDHVRMQAGVQQYIDSSISKTINVPEDISFEDLEGVYLQAYDLGCKGCTTFRPNDITGTVLDVSKPTEAPVPASSTPVNSNAPLARPEELPGSTYKVRWPDSDHAMYITVNDTIQDGQRRPFEVFINSKNMDHFAWTVALTRMISAVFRRGGDVAFVVEELQAVFDPRGGQWMGGRYVPSLLAAIGDVIERHLVAIGFVPPKEVAAAAVPAPEVPSEGLARPIGRTCPGCGQPTLVRKENCDGCSCGYSRC